MSLRRAHHTLVCVLAQRRGETSPLLLKKTLCLACWGGEDGRVLGGVARGKGVFMKTRDIVIAGWAVLAGCLMLAGCPDTSTNTNSGGGGGNSALYVGAKAAAGGRQSIAPSGSVFIERNADEVPPAVNLDEFFIRFGSMDGRNLSNGDGLLGFLNQDRNNNGKPYVVPFSAELSDIGDLDGMKKYGKGNYDAIVLHLAIQNDDGELGTPDNGLGDFNVIFIKKDFIEGQTETRGFYQQNLARPNQHPDWTAGQPIPGFTPTAGWTSAADLRAKYPMLKDIAWQEPGPNNNYQGDIKMHGYFAVIPFDGLKVWNDDFDVFFEWDTSIITEILEASADIDYRFGVDGQEPTQLVKDFYNSLSLRVVYK